MRENEHQEPNRRIFRLENLGHRLSAYSKELTACTAVTTLIGYVALSYIPGMSTQILALFCGVPLASTIAVNRTINHYANQYQQRLDAENHAETIDHQVGRSLGINIGRELSVETSHPVVFLSPIQQTELSIDSEETSSDEKYRHPTLFNGNRSQSLPAEFLITDQSLTP